MDRGANPVSLKNRITPVTFVASSGGIDGPGLQPEPGRNPSFQRRTSAITSGRERDFSQESLARTIPDESTDRIWRSRRVDGRPEQAASFIPARHDPGKIPCFSEQVGRPGGIEVLDLLDPAMTQYKFTTYLKRFDGFLLDRGSELTPVLEARLLANYCLKKPNPTQTSLQDYVDANIPTRTELVAHICQTILAPHNKSKGEMMLQKLKWNPEVDTLAAFRAQVDGAMHEKRGGKTVSLVDREEMARYFIQGLPPEYRSYIREHNYPETLEGYMQGAETHRHHKFKEKYESDQDQIREKLAQAESKGGSSSNPNSSRKTEVQQSKKAAKNTQHSMRMKTMDGKCFCCGQEGHIKPKCPQRPHICGNCGREGHLRALCAQPSTMASITSLQPPEIAQTISRTKGRKETTRRSRSESPNFSTGRNTPVLSEAAQRTLGSQVPGSALDQPDPGIPVVEEIGPTVLLRLEIEGIQVEAIGDTGAQSVLLPQWCEQELIAKHGKQWWDGRWKSSDAYFESATGHPTVTGGIHFLTINDGYTRVVVPCHVHCESYTKEKSARSRVLLGTNALRGLGFLMTSASGELIMTPSHYQIPLTVFVDTEEGTQQVYSGKPWTHPMGDGWPTESIRQREGNPDIPEFQALPKPKGIRSPSRSKVPTPEKTDTMRVPNPTLVQINPHSPEKLQQLQREKHAAKHLPTKKIPELRQRRAKQKPPDTNLSRKPQTHHSPPPRDAPSPRDMTLGGVFSTKQGKEQRFDQSLNGWRRVPQVSFASKNRIRQLPTITTEMGKRIAAEDVEETRDTRFAAQRARRARREAASIYYILAATPPVPLGVRLDEMEPSLSKGEGGKRGQSDEDFDVKSNEGTKNSDSSLPELSQETERVNPLSAKLSSRSWKPKKTATKKKKKPSPRSAWRDPTPPARRNPLEERTPTEEDEVLAPKELYAAYQDIKAIVEDEKTVKELKAPYFTIRKVKRTSSRPTMFVQVAHNTPLVADPNHKGNRQFVKFRVKDWSIWREEFAGSTLRFIPDPAMKRHLLYVTDCLVVPSSKGCFYAEVRSAHVAELILGRQTVGKMEEVSQIPSKEAAETMVAGLGEDVWIPTGKVENVNFIGPVEVDEAAAKRARIREQLKVESDLLTPELTQQVWALVDRFSDAFATTPEELGNTDLLQHDIQVKDATRPIAQRNRQLPHSVRGEIVDKIKELLDQGIIQESSSDWASPIVPVRKKNGEIRMCIDYRRLNEATIKDNSPLSHLSELWEMAGARGNKVFSGFDLMSGYHQVGMTPFAQKVSAFVSPIGLFEYTRMPFGLSNAPATFSNLMRKVLSTLQNRSIFAYLDDVLIATKNVQDHMEHLEALLHRLCQVGLTIQPKKSFLFRREIQFLGFIVSESGLKPDPSKLDAVQKFPLPKTITELKGFHALCSYYRRFIKDFAKICQPLTNAFRGKPRLLIWTQPMLDAFEDLKRAMVSPGVLAFPRLGQPYILGTDGSKLGLGADLLQEQVDGTIHPVSYASRAVSEVESRYSATDLEACAVIFGLDHFDVYIRGHPVTLVTDHKALKYILASTNKLANDRQQRWRNRALGMDLKIQYKPGKDHIVPDVLSRNPLPDSAPKPEDPTPLEADRYDGIFSIISPPADLSDKDSSDESESEEEINRICPVTAIDGSNETDHLDKELGYPFVQGLGTTIGQADVDRQMMARAEQRKDPVLQALGDYLENGKMTTNEEIQHWVTIWTPFCSVHEGLLYYGKPDRWEYDRKIVPHHLRHGLLLEYHTLSCGGHYSARKTFDTLRQKYWWPQMKQDVQQFIDDCMNCSTKSGQGRRAVPPMKNLPVPATPNEIVCMDLLSLPKTPRGKHYVMAITDLLTRQAFAFAIPNKEAATVARTLYSKYFVHHGPPKEIITDRGTEFTAAVFRELCSIHGVVNQYTTVLHPAANGVVERFNRVLATFFAKMRDRKKVEWDLQLPGLLMVYNSTYHRAVGMSPHEAAYGYPMRRVSHCILEADPPFMPEGATPSELGVLARAAHLKAAEHLVKYNQAAKEKFNVDKEELSKFHEGDNIWLLHEQKGKYNRPFTGPWKIMKIRDTNAVIERIHPTKLRPESRTAWIGNFTLCRRKDLTTTWDGRGRKSVAPIPPFPDSFKARRREFRDALDLRLREERAKRWPEPKTALPGGINMMQAVQPEEAPSSSMSLKPRDLGVSLPPPLCGVKQKRQLGRRAVREARVKRFRSRSVAPRTAINLFPSFLAALQIPIAEKEIILDREERKFIPIFLRKRRGKLKMQHQNAMKAPSRRPRYPRGDGSSAESAPETSGGQGSGNLAGDTSRPNQQFHLISALDDPTILVGSALWEERVLASDIQPVPMMPGLDRFHWKQDGVKDTPPWVNTEGLRLLPMSWRGTLERLRTQIFPRPVRQLFPNSPGVILPIKEFLRKRRGQPAVERFAGASILVSLQRLGMDVRTAFHQLWDMHEEAYGLDDDDEKERYRAKRRVVLKAVELARYWVQLAAGPKLMAFQAAADRRTELYFPPYFTDTSYLELLEVLETPILFQTPEGLDMEMTQQELLVEFHYHYQTKITVFVDTTLSQLWYARSWSLDLPHYWYDQCHPWICGEYYHEDTRGTVRDVVFLPHRVLWEDLDLSNRTRLPPPPDRSWETASEQRMLLPGIINFRAFQRSSYELPKPNTGFGIHPYEMDSYLDKEYSLELMRMYARKPGSWSTSYNSVRARALRRIMLEETRQRRAQMSTVQVASPIEWRKVGVATTPKEPEVHPKWASRAEAVRTEVIPAQFRKLSSVDGSAQVPAQESKDVVRFFLPEESSDTDSVDSKEQPKITKQW